MKQPELTPIGFISKLHGFRGELVCIIEQGDAEDYSLDKFLFLKIDGFNVPFFVESYKNKNGNAVVKFEDVNDVEKAKRYLKKEVLAEVRAIEEAEEDEWEDIVGYEAIDNTYGSLGKIERLEEYPQQMIAICIVNKKEVLIPLSDEIVVVIDDDKRIVQLDLPDGLIDIYLAD